MAGGENIGQGKEAAKDFLRDNPALYEDLRGQVKDLLFAKKE